MFGLSKLKQWAIAAGAAIAAVGFFILHFMNLGRKAERAEAIEEAEKQEDEHDSLVDNARRAGNSARVQPVSKDPYDRANR